jgi:Predicted DNA binding protein
MNSMKSRYPIESVIQIKRDDCNITNALNKMKGVKSVSRLKIEPDQTLHVVEKDQFSENELKVLNSTSKKVTHVGKNKLWIYGKSCSACRSMALSNAVVISAISTDSDHVMFRVIMENRTALKILVRSLCEDGVETTVVEEPLDQKNDMSEREYSVLKMCYNLGFFDNDRANSLTEIARVLGISTSSLSETLRRAMKKAAKEFIMRKSP